MYVIVTRRSCLSFRGRVADLRAWLRDQRQLWSGRPGGEPKPPGVEPFLAEVLEAWVAGRAPVIRWPR
ncbi:MAG TPA: hypothetical protein VGL40_14865 [Bacillota bacterium]